MKMEKKTTVAGAFARKVPYTYQGESFDADLKNGDTITILSAGEVVTGQFGDQKVFSVQTRNGSKNLSFNQKTENVLVDEFGDDSVEYVGKEVTVIIKKDTVAGKKVDIVFLVPVGSGWHLDEYGDLVKEEDAPMGDDGAPDPDIDML